MAGLIPVKRESCEIMPGGARPGAGRPKGSKNRLTPERQAFLRAFIDGTQDQAIEDWKAITDSADRFRLWLAAAEYCYPKLGRQELVGPDGAAAIQVIINKAGAKPEAG